MTEWRNRIVDRTEEAPDQLLANPRNWRIHPHSQEKALVAVLDEVGWVTDVVANRRTGFVVDGHLRVAAAISRGERTVPVTWVDLSDEEEALILATFDPLAGLAVTETEVLSGLLKDIRADTPDVDALLGDVGPDFFGEGIGWNLGADVGEEQSGEGDEWYTPPWLFEALGLRFSMDVCAPQSPTARTCPADRYFTAADDGLAQEWAGTVWCNPPYSDPAPWVERMIGHGDGLLLTIVSPGAGWVSDLWRAFDGLRLFHRIGFVRPDGSVQEPGTWWFMLSSFGDAATEALGALTIPAEVAANKRHVPSPMLVRT